MYVQDINLDFEHKYMYWVAYQFEAYPSMVRWMSKLV